MGCKLLYTKGSHPADSRREGPNSSTQPHIIMSDTTSDQLDPEAGFTSTPTVGEAASDLRTAAGEKAKEIMQGAEAKANRFREVASTKATAFKDAAAKQADQFKVAATEQWENTRVRAKEFHGTAEDYIRENPTKCVLGALGIGFLAGLIMRR